MLPWLSPSVDGAPWPNSLVSLSFSAFSFSI
jgi:hypothetical protein